MKDWKHIFKTFCKLTIAAVYVLILVGGIVRASGSGMGCPDWPKCFGSWVPPTSVDQLPDNYQEIFGEKLKGEVLFNPIKTWVEYVNRLVGVLIGIFIFITFILSIKAYWKTNKKVVWLSLLAFIGVSLEGWLGAKVVSTELHPLLITVHMLGAVLIVFTLIYALYTANGSSHVNKKNGLGLNFLVGLALILSFGQLILGTQVREVIDHVVNNLKIEDRTLWIDHIGGSLYFHAVLGLGVVLVNFILFKKLKKEPELSKWAYILISIVFMSFISGLIMGFISVFAVLQPVHLLNSTLILGIQFYIFLLGNPKIAIE